MLSRASLFITTSVSTRTTLSTKTSGRMQLNHTSVTRRKSTSSLSLTRRPSRRSNQSNKRARTLELFKMPKLKRVRRTKRAKRLSRKRRKRSQHFQERFKRIRQSLTILFWLVLHTPPTRSTMSFQDTSQIFTKQIAKLRRPRIKTLKSTKTSRATLKELNLRLSTKWLTKNAFGSSLSSTAHRDQPFGLPVSLEKFQSFQRLNTSRSKSSSMLSKLHLIIYHSKLVNINFSASTSSASQRKIRYFI